METRTLGRSDIAVPPLCLGGNVFGWTIDETRSFEVLDAAFAAGLTFIDTADVYSRWAEGHVGGESETIIGKWMKARGNRDRIVLATKVGMDMGDGKVGLKPDYIRQAVEVSLRRLQTDRIDLYQSHKDDPDTPQAETLGAYAELVKAGKVRIIGASNYSPERFSEALTLSEQHGLPRYETMQPEYNLYTRADYENGLEPVCLANQVSVIPFFGLAAGFLTGKYRSEADLGKSPRGARSISRYLNDRGYRILAALDAVAARRAATPARVALAWQIARPSITAPIASATSVEQVRELAASMSLKLAAQDIAELDAASAG
ncbi:oxidoreductase [Alsobacter metallidurans]|uniref:Oxidoreductase n=1 Tax=Alsobacter metallidurans TaxID=340221 RepID=A0A917I6U0_9HYPH|nr:aldo/keto reductase [Alsobacter metallidurans]GGH18523.1 oxidoreductase [Alsobacter metallidurans]